MFLACKWKRPNDFKGKFVLHNKNKTTAWKWKIFRFFFFIFCSAFNAIDKTKYAYLCFVINSFFNSFGARVFFPFFLFFFFILFVVICYLYTMFSLSFRMKRTRIAFWTMLFFHYCTMNGSTKTLRPLSTCTVQLCKMHLQNARDTFSEKILRDLFFPHH